jgi:hypothetical protein
VPASLVLVYKEKRAVVVLVHRIFSSNGGSVLVSCGFNSLEIAARVPKKRS